jgi:hypothetical protein
MLLDGGASLGALAAGLPLLLQARFSQSMLGSYRAVFFAYAGLCLPVAVLYLFRSPAVESGGSPAPGSIGARIELSSKKIIARVTALFELDAFGGGFLTDALVAYWFFRRFGVAEHDLGLVFFVVHILNTLSHLGAA